MKEKRSAELPKGSQKAELSGKSQELQSFLEEDETIWATRKEIPPAWWAVCKLGGVLQVSSLCELSCWEQ